MELGGQLLSSERRRYVKRQLISRSRKILPKLAILSGEKIP
jgi:hypothetical protein